MKWNLQERLTVSGHKFGKFGIFNLVLFWLGIVANEALRDIWNNNFEFVAPIAFAYERNTTKSLRISNTLRDFYLRNRSINLETVDDFGKLYADGIGWSANRLATLVAKSNDYPVYYYKFAYKGRFSHFYSPFTNKTIGKSD